MKPTEDLKNQAEKTESKDEKKKLIENTGVELTDDQMDQVAGGIKLVVIQSPGVHKIQSEKETGIKENNRHDGGVTS